MLQKYSIWMSEPQFAHVEVAYACGVRRLVIDIEHGVFPLHELDRFLAFTKVRGMHVLAKVAGPNAEAIQQAIDCGADGVIIPHILNAEHAAEICVTAKFPPLGTRSFFGGRPTGHTRPADDYLEVENKRVQCYPMIETASAIADVEAIAALPFVDGLFPGPTDLSVSCGRGLYRFTETDRIDLIRCANAVKKHGKKWVMPAWTAAEREMAREHGADEIVVSTQFMTIRAGVHAAQAALRAEGFSID